MMIAARLLSILSFLALILLGHAGTIVAQSTPSGWTTPTYLFEPDPDWYDVFPNLAADRWGMTHLAWFRGPRDGVDGAAVIMYSRWNGSTWTQPIDVFAGSEAGWPVLLATRDGRLHLFRSASGRIVQSWAWPTDADSAKAWTPSHYAACDDCIPFLDVKEDDADILHLVYVSKSSGVAYVRSLDSGLTWSDPVQISRINDPAWNAFHVRLAVAGDGLMHVVWSENANDGRVLSSVMYAQSRDGGETWSAPLLLAADGYDDPNILAVNPDIVHIVWNGGVGYHGRFHIMSLDGGLSWTAPRDISDGASGRSGYPALAMDSIGELHVVISAALGVGHTSWDGIGWSPVVALNHTEASGEQLTMTINRGNQVIAVWPKGALTSGFEYTTKVLDVPEIAPEELPARPVPSATPLTLQPVSSQTPQPTQIPPLSRWVGNDQPAPKTPDQWIGLLLSVLPVILLVGAVVIWQARRR